jgi:4-amino-4-deoxy-L-arabinose transferase-like glycosyltransferase
MARLRGFDVTLLLILCLATAFRLYRVDVPYVDAHSWRQVQNADIARLWSRGPFNLFYPPVSWGGPDGVIGSEFPLVHAVTAGVWRAFGYSDALGRFVGVCFSVAAVWALYLLGARLFGKPTGRAAAALLAISPGAIYFGRLILSDTPMVLFSILGIWGYLAYFDEGRPRFAVMGAVCVALAGLVKLPAALVFMPVAWIAWRAKRWQGIFDSWFLPTTVAAAGAIGLWYLHADRIAVQTGLTVAIFRPAGTLPWDVMPFTGPISPVSSWTRLETLRNMRVWGTLWERMVWLHLTPIGTALVFIGFATLWRCTRRTVVDAWTLAALLFCLVSMEGQRHHQFYQLPLLPPLMLYAGAAAAPVFDRRSYRRFGSAALPAMGVALLAVSLLAVVQFRHSGVIPDLYRVGWMNYPLIRAGEAINHATPKKALLVTIEYDHGGTNSPMLLYFADRHGWSFDAESMLPITIDYLRTQGACYVATSHWSLLEAIRPQSARRILQFREIPLSDADPDYRLFDLGCFPPPAQTHQSRLESR